MDLKSCLKSLLRSARRYHFASMQDKNPVVAARHNGYAVALIDAVVDIAPPEVVKSATGEDARKLRAEILAVQDAMESKVMDIVKSLEAKGIKLPF